MAPADGPRERWLYLAYPTSPTLASANAVQTFHTLRELRRLRPDLLAIVVRFRRGPSAFEAVGAVHLPRIPIGRLSRLWRSALLYYLERSAFAWLTLAYLLWRRLRHRERYPLIYVRDVILAGWFLAFRPLLGGSRLVYEVHNLESREPSRAKERWVQPLLRWWDRRLLRKADRLASLTGTFRERLASEGLRDPAEVDVIPDAYDDATYVPRPQGEAREALGLDREGFYVVYAGLTFKYRSLDVLVAAFARALPRLPEGATLWLVGGQPTEREALERQARGLGIGDRVRLPGRVPQAHVALYLAAADLLVLPDTVSKETASPLKLFEYMAMGRPIVCADLPALREVLDESGGVFVPPRDEEALARALIELARDPERRRRLGEGARRLAAEHTYRRRAERIVACGLRALGRKEGGG